MLGFHRCSPRPKISPSHPLAGKRVYIPIMAEGASEAFASCFRWFGIDAEVTPASSAHTRELGSRFTCGDECYPAIVTLGDLLHAAEQPGFNPVHSVFLMPTAEGPCRFGQYAFSLKKVLREAGCGDVGIISPTDRNGYADLGDIASAFTRMAWRAIVATDTLHKALLRTRSHETIPGTTDRVYLQCHKELCDTIESACGNTSCQLRSLVQSMVRARERFRRIAARFKPEIPLIGIVGEIFCRLNSFSNDDLVRKLEAHGAEAWLSGIGEWISYANDCQIQDLRLRGRAFSLAMAGAQLRTWVQRADEHVLIRPFAADCVGYVEPEIEEVLELAWPYLPVCGVVGEMVLSVGKAAYLAKHGADGIIDISPFSCMNGIVSEAIYPKLSKDYGGIPIRNFYFDGTHSDLDRDLGIYLELAHSYHEAKKYGRRYPAYFAPPRHEDVHPSFDAEGQSEMSFSQSSLGWVP
jgi:predicted nucleotide-binding protein (sugar kinase/HSP70/actin superfamily)